MRERESHPVTDSSSLFVGYHTATGRDATVFIIQYFGLIVNTSMLEQESTKPQQVLYFCISLTMLKVVKNVCYNFGGTLL